MANEYLTSLPLVNLTWQFIRNRVNSMVAVLSEKEITVSCSDSKTVSIGKKIFYLYLKNNEKFNHIGIWFIELLRGPLNANHNFTLEAPIATGI